MTGKEVVTKKVVREGQEAVLTGTQMEIDEALSSKAPVEEPKAAKTGKTGKTGKNA